MSEQSESSEQTAAFAVLTSNQEIISFARSEYDHVTKYSSVIYDTRDRFFANYMTVAIALFGFLGFLLSQETGNTNGGIRERLMTLATFMLAVLLVFGLGSLFLLSGNWLARDYYRQRKKVLQAMILSSGSEDRVSEALADYLSFSRDKTDWSYRPTSIYIIYLSSIAVANGLALLIGLSFSSFNLENTRLTAVFIGAFFFQHLLCYLYIRLYTRKAYPEG